MRPFNRLTHRGRLRRLHALAREALERWPIDVKKVRLLGHHQNTVYNVLDHSGDRWVLRVSDSPRQTPVAVRSELLWLQAMSEEGLAVPSPSPGRDGALLQVVTREGVPGPRCCVLFPWIEGRVPDQVVYPSDMRRAGRTMAAVHNHGERWQPPPEFDRWILDADGMMGPRAVWGDPMEVPGMDDESREVFALAHRYIGRALEQLRRDYPSWGLVHADAHLGNFVFKRDRGALIDFDDCGVGFFLIDIDTVWRDCAYEQDFERLKDSFLEGYDEVRPLSDEVLSFLPEVHTAHRIADLAWVAARATPYERRTLMPRLIRRAVDTVRNLMADGPMFLPL